ncbi:DUF6471 domain-containing protein [Rubrivivax sp. RP6-9]|uniref:DUF6471 domain-containing protein n=1 Tax=Rubrivivax sp. RP6-9 TaxID=3415750 RepID=UPI003CC58442
MAVDWADAASRLLKTELAREQVTLAQLARRLAALGVVETEASLKNKLYRGTFQMTFFVQCMQALGRSTVDIGAVIPPGVPKGSELD